VSYAIGLFAAVLVAAFARWSGFDRDRSFYSTVLIVVASYYVLFAVMGGSIGALVQESAAMSVFALCATVGFKRSPWIVVAGLAAHGVFDFFHVHAVSNPGVPEWWPGFCLSYDVGAAAVLAWLLLNTTGVDPRRSRSGA
jgi:hypothetical protein